MKGTWKNMLVSWFYTLLHSLRSWNVRSSKTVCKLLMASETSWWKKTVNNIFFLILQATTWKQNSIDSLEPGWLWSNLRNKLGRDASWLTYHEAKETKALVCFLQAGETWIFPRGYVSNFEVQAEKVFTLESCLDHFLNYLGVIDYYYWFYLKGLLMQIWRIADMFISQHVEK